MSDILEKPEVTTTDNGDHDRFAHYADKDDIMLAMIEGVPCVALCGKVFVPTRDPEKFKVCPECMEIYQTLE